MEIYKDLTQLLILPAVGFVKDRGGVWLTIAFLWWGISFRVCRFPGA